MNRYIDADKLKETLASYHPFTTKQELKFGKIIKIINEESTADVRENIKGEWIEIETSFEKYKPKDCFSLELKKYIRKKYKCSICGKEKQYKDNFCPECGADMRQVKQ